jgi:hypothetical protein
MGGQQERIAGDDSREVRIAWEEVRMKGEQPLVYQLGNLVSGLEAGSPHSVGVHIHQHQVV